MTNSKDKSIGALIAGCRDGNKHDWSELIERLSPAIFSACYRFRLSREESYDVFGKVSLSLLENLTNLREEKRIFGYVATIAHHEAAALRARNRMFRKKADELVSELHHEDGFQSMILPIEKDQDLEIMQKAFSGISDKCQKLLRMLFLDTDNISYRDISRELGIPVASIGPTRGRCLQRLRAQMIKEGFEE
jgi:RNA polymerase sigma factor (sigma-70 family)